MSSEAPLEVNPDSLQSRAARFVERHLQVDAIDLVSRRREGYVVTARALFVWCVRWSSPSVSYPLVGRWLGRDHSTIINLSRKAEILIGRDPEFARWCEDWRAHQRSRMEVPHACA